MKKLLLLIMLSFCTTFVSQAQELHFGAKAGLNFASARGDDADDLKTRTSFNVGGVLNVGFTEKLALQSELFYSGQGYSIEREDSGGTVTSDGQTIVLEKSSGARASGDDTVKLDYINLPILFDYTISDGLSLQAGPQIAFNISSKAEFGGDEIDLKDQTNGTSFSGVLGAQYKLPLGVFFQARYALGLSNIPKEDAFDAKNAVFSISAGYFFN